MTVEELILELKTLPQDLIVIMSKDAEGNRYSPIVETDVAYYEADSTWSGERVESPGDGVVEAVFLWPTN